jgi:hypothetical protein
MKFNNLKIFRLFAFCPLGLCVVQGTAQELISTSSGSGVVGGVTMEGSVGETVITTGTSGETTFNQGFHQPQFVVTGIEKFGETPGRMRIYPNPVRDNLTVMPEGFDAALQFAIEVTDLSGKQLLNQNCGAEGAVLRLQDLPAAQYLLRVTADQSRYSEIFKIIKTQ